MPPDRSPVPALWRGSATAASARAIRVARLLLVGAACPVLPLAAPAAGQGIAHPSAPTATVPVPAPGSAPVAVAVPAPGSAAGTAPDAAAGPRFVRIETGIPHAYTGGWEHFVGGGVAVFDCDGDRLPELYMAGGTSPAILVRNGGGMAFRDATPPALALTGVTGAYPLDIDGDGAVDLAILRVGPDLLMRGDGHCGFAPFGGLGFESGEHWTTAFSATWEAGATLPTLAFGTYVDRTDPDGPFEACDATLLYRPENLIFGLYSNYNTMTPRPDLDTPRYAPPLRLEPGKCALSALFSDWGHTGRQDLRLSNDRQYYVRDGEEQLWAMEPTPRLYTEAEGWRTYRLWGMGIASRDIDGDGRPEVFLTSMADQKLQTLSGPGPTYSDAPYERGTTAQRPYQGDDGRPSTGWHAAWGDVDLDGRDDLFIAKGNVEQMPSNAMYDPNNLLMQQPDGSFREAAPEAGIARPDKSRGAALADLDADGRLDLVVVNRGADWELWRNLTAPQGHWTAIALRQPGPNRGAIGAWIELDADGRTLWREVTVGGGHAGGTLGPEHFGLGPATRLRARVHWPDGTASAWTDLALDRTLTLSRDGDALSVSSD